jgi:D-3-phosphoglycerate dehydrogenase
MARILVTPRSLTADRHPAIDRLRADGHEIVLAPAGSLPDEATLRALVPGVDGWIAGVEPVSPAVIAAADRLVVISRNGTGVDNLPLDDLARRGIAVRIAGGANAAGVAELAVGLMFAALRHIPATDAGVKAGGWPRLRGREIRGRTVGVVGCGAIGGEVARLVAALGAHVLAFDPRDPPLDVPAGQLVRVDIDALVAGADVVTLHCPSMPGGGPLLDAGRIARLRPGAVVINTARASLVDEAALIAGLDAGRPGVYAADTFPQEPPTSLGLAGHPRVIATSHIGGFTDESVDRATEAAVANLLDQLAAAR